MEPISFAGCFVMCIGTGMGLFVVVRRHVNHLYRKVHELLETTAQQQRQIDELKRELEAIKR